MQRGVSAQIGPRVHVTATGAPTMDGLGQPVCFYQDYAPDNPNGMTRHPISRNEGAITWAGGGKVVIIG